MVDRKNLFFKGADVRNQSWQPEIKAQKRPIAFSKPTIWGKFSTCLLPKLHWTIRVKDFVRLTRSVQREKLYPPVHANFPTIGALYLH